MAEAAFRGFQADYDALMGERGRPISVVDVRDTTGRSLERYVERTASGGLGLITGIEPIDDAVGGLRHGEIWIHAGYSGERKTTLRNESGALMEAR